MCCTLGLKFDLPEPFYILKFQLKLNLCKNILPVNEFREEVRIIMKYAYSWNLSQSCCQKLENFEHIWLFVPCGWLNCVHVVVQDNSYTCPMCYLFWQVTWWMGPLGSRWWTCLWSPPTMWRWFSSSSTCSSNWKTWPPRMPSRNMTLMGKARLKKLVFFHYICYQAESLAYERS